MVMQISSKVINAPELEQNLNSKQHSLFEDTQALLSGSLFVSLCMTMFAQAGLLTGSTAGLAFVLHYATGESFSMIYFVINLPFYWFAWIYVGKAFAIKTFISVALSSLITYITPLYIRFDYLHPAFAAIVGGFLLGTGVLFLARHKSSLGGATIISLYAQEKWGVKAGYVQMTIDCIVVLLAIWIVPIDQLLWSLLAAIIVGIFLALNHRPGRYKGY